MTTYSDMIARSEHDDTLANMIAEFNTAQADMEAVYPPFQAAMDTYRAAQAIRDAKYRAIIEYAA